MRAPLRRGVLRSTRSRKAASTWRSYSPCGTPSSETLRRVTHEVTVDLTRETSVQECSKVFEGLERLEDQGRIALRIDSRTTRRSYPRVLGLSVRSEGDSCRIAIDLSDQPGSFHAPDLEEVDVYFKRSFWPSAVGRLPESLRGKVRPFGLNNPSIGIPTTLWTLRARLQTGRSARGLAADARQLLALPSPSAFE